MKLIWSSTSSCWASSWWIRGRRLSFVPGVAAERARGDPPERATHDGSGAVVAHVHGEPGEAAARDAHEVRVPAADGAGLCGDRAVQRTPEVHPDYSYKEATLNPTNPRNRRGLGSRRRQHLPQHADHHRVDRQRDIAGGPLALSSRPIQIKNKPCLDCHSNVEPLPNDARFYGSANGFGWKMDEVIGAQIVRCR